ncbi:hypothetical protein RE628_11325 [Paenibacillus sp. D2_2]|uniref:hypothetical protein n=1 Tax=Paenibacillus sp. D2_2 TaxID=3073092 RepID=UPI0028166C66|nr:hypothetical protein [Paenibacillus sp. D2_2]WMT42818.1 hypothetical protein RE628_11325 [Paenibacillus sp. D2_2]
MNNRIQELIAAVDWCKSFEYSLFHITLTAAEEIVSEYDRLQEGRNAAIRALEKAEQFISAMMEFYGEGLTVYNWHQNGDGEPWDNFFDSNMEGNELESIRTALSHLKG